MTKKLTRLIALMLSVIMAFSVLLVPVEAASFTDVSDSAWYKAAVDYVYERGWMAGVSQTSFAPNSEVTRGMMVTVLARVAGAETDNTTSAFSDTASGKWYTGAAAWAAENGIVAGVGNGCFAPNRAITRQDLCVMLYAYIKANGIELENTIDRTFSDMESVNDYAREAVIYCTGTGLIAGFDDSTFRPKDTATRAQAAQIFMRLDLLIKEGTAPSDPMPAQKFTGNVGKDMSVYVEAPEGALPESSDLVLERCTDDVVLNVIRECVGGQILAAADISFAKDGAETEPEKAVDVQIYMDGLESYENPMVVHVRDDYTVEFVESRLINTTRGGGKALSFSAQDFSVYAVVDADTNNNSSRLVVKIWKRDGDTRAVVDKKVLVTRQDVNRLATIIPDGETPTTAGKEIFCGWFVDTEPFGHTITENGVELEVAGLNEARFEVTDADGAHTMNAARDQIKALLQDPDFVIQDSITTVNIYPIIYNYFVVSLVDENGETTFDTTVIYTKENSAYYTPQLVYSPYLSGYRFLGWQKDDGDPTVYENGDEAEVTQQNTVFRAQVQRGYWLTFVENPDGNHKGATYNGPRFCVDGVVTSAQRPADPTLAGYTFGGWYTDDNFNTPFNFTGTIGGDTPLYAKWIQNEKVPYTVIVWRQSVNDLYTYTDAQKTYDFAFSTTVGGEGHEADGVAPGTAVSSLDLSAFKNKDGQSITVDGTTYSFTGFKQNTTMTPKTGSGNVSVGAGIVANSTTVKVSGTTVINIYYDRQVCTITFWIKPYVAYTGTNSSTLLSNNSSTVFFVKHNTYGYCPIRYRSSSYQNLYYPTTNSYSTTNPQYGIVDGTWYELVWRQHSTTGVYYWAYLSNSTYYAYDGTRYYLYDYGNYTGYTWYYIGDWTVDTDYNTYTGLYGQRLDDVGYTWPTDYRWFIADGSSEFISILDKFTDSANENPTDAYHTDFYGYKESFDTNVYHYLMDTNGNWPSTANKTIPTKVGNGMVFRSFQGFTSSVFRIKLPSNVTTYTTGTEYDGDNLVSPVSHTTATGWTEWLPSGTGVEYSGNTRHELTRWSATEGGIEFRYTRNKYRITYMVGNYYDDAGNVITGPVTGELKQTDPIYYQKDIEDFADFYTNPVEDIHTDEFVFDDWYIDPTCTIKYDFTDQKMPLNGLTLYAKFVQKEYRVFVHTNIPTTLDTQYVECPSHPDWITTGLSNMKVDYKDVVENGNPIVIRDLRGENAEWVLVGWFADAACTTPYNFETRLTDSTTVEYKKTEVTDYGPYTASNGTVYDSAGEGFNKDAAENRYWITGKLEIYAKWRRILSGANGIHVDYDAIEYHDPETQQDYDTGRFAEYDPQTVTEWSDPLAYTDQAHVIARSASTPDESDEMFLYWQILDSQGRPYTLVDGTLDPAKLVYPGQDFVVDFADAADGTITNPINEHQHTWVHYPEKAPSCLDGNWDYWYCTSCGKYAWGDGNGNPNVNSNAAYEYSNGYGTPGVLRPGTGNHTFGDWESNGDATHSKTCSVCGLRNTENCDFEVTVVDPTETTEGYTLHTCKVCEYSYMDNYLPALKTYYTVTAVVSGSGAVDPESAAVEEAVGTARFTASPFAHQIFTGATVEPAAAASVSVSGNVITVSNVTADCTLTLTFREADTYTVTYMANGSELSHETVYENDTVTLPNTVPDVANNTFLGWVGATVSETATPQTYKAPGATSDPITANTTFYALYQYERTQNETVYQLLTAEPESWLGNHVITYLSTSSLIAMKGLSGSTSYESASAGGAVAYASTGMTLDSVNGTPILKNVSNDYIFEITAASTSGKYKLQNLTTGTYLGSYGTTAALYSRSSYSSTYCDWSLSYDTVYDATKASNSFSSDYPYLARHSSGSYFTVNTTSNYRSYPPQFWSEATLLVTTTYYSTTPSTVANCEVTVVSNNTNYGTVTPGSATVTAGGQVSFTATVGTDCQYATPAYTVLEGTATVEKNGDVFTVVPTTSCTIQINFKPKPTYTVTYMANGSQYGETVSVVEGKTVTLPSTATGVEGARFIGWVTAEYPANTAQPATVYLPGTASPAINANTTFYALYSYTEGGSGVRYTPVNVVETNKDYLIGYKNGSSVYLIMNYNADNSNNYYASYGASYYAYGVQAQMDGDDVVGVYTDVYPSAELEFVEWQFVASGSTYQIRSNHNESYYLKVYTTSTSWYDCFAVNDSSYNKWSYNASTHRLSYAVSTSDTRYLTYVATHGTYSNVFSAPTSYDATTSTIQLYSQADEGTTYYSTTVSGTERFTVTAESNNTDYGTVSVSGSPVTGSGVATITATPAAGYTYANPAYTVTSGTANVTQDGNTFTVAPTSSCTVRINFEALPTYTVTYMGNGGSGTTASQSGYQGSSVNIRDNGFTYAGYTFTGWNTAANGSGTAFTVGQSYTLTANLTLYAQWTVVAEKWTPVTSIDTSKDLLIGLVVGDTVYLAVNYSDVNSNYYASIGNTYRGYVALASLDGADVTTAHVESVSGNATDLQYCMWKFSDATGDTIQSSYQSGYYLNTWSSTYYEDCYPASGTGAGTGWVWNSSAHTLYRTISSTNRYVYYYTGNYMSVQSSVPTGSYIQIYQLTSVAPAATYTVTAATTDSTHAPVTVTGSPVVSGNSATISVDLASGYTYASPAYTVTSGTATVTQSGNVFTVTPSSDCTVRINVQQIQTYTVTYSANGSTMSTASVEGGSTTTLPSTATAAEGYEFVGWSESTVADTTTAPTCYEPGATSPAITGNKTFYAVYTRTNHTGKTFTKLTSTPSDWTGNYVITYTDSASTMYVLKGLSDSVSYEEPSNRGAIALANTGAALSGSTLSSVGDVYVFAAEDSGTSGYYTFRNLGTGAYLARYADAEDALLYAMTTSYTDYANFIKWQPTVQSGGNVYLANSTPDGYSTDYPNLGFNTTEKVFWVGSSGSTSTTSIYLWKESASGEVVTYTTTASAPSSTYTVSFSTPDGVTAPSTITVRQGESTVLPAAGNASGYLFIGWSETDITDTTTIPAFLTEGAVYTPSANKELKAVYTYDDTYYQKLTSAPSSYAGYFVITSGTTASDYMMASMGSGTYTGNSSGRTQMNSVTLSDSNTVMRNVPAENVFWISNPNTTDTTLATYVYFNNNDDCVLRYSSGNLISYQPSGTSLAYADLWLPSYSGGVFSFTSYSASSYRIVYSSTNYFSLDTSGGIYLWQRHTDMHYLTNPGSGSGTTTHYYNKVTSASDLTSGTYLIVSEDDNLAFNGSLTTLDASGNGTAVTISANAIEATSAMDAISFTLAQSGSYWTIKSASGYYIGRTGTTNGMNTSQTSSYNNSISFSSGNAVITSNSLYLRYYYPTGTGGQRFRYYTGSGTGRNIQLYKRDAAPTASVTEPMNVSAAKALRIAGEYLVMDDPAPVAEPEKPAETETFGKDLYVEAMDIDPAEAEGTRSADITPIVGAGNTVYELASSIQSGQTYLIVWGNANTAANCSTMYAMNSYTGTANDGYKEIGTITFKPGSSNSVITAVDVATGSIADCEWTAASASNSTYTFVNDGYYLVETSSDDYSLSAVKSSSSSYSYRFWKVVKSTTTGAEFFNIHNYYWNTQYSSRYYYLYYRSGSSYGFTNYYNTNTPGTYSDNYRMFLYKKTTVSDAVITFNTTGGSSVASQTVPIGTNATLTSTVPTRDHYRFTGWNTMLNGGGDPYAPGDPINLSGDITLYAQWVETCNVTFVDTYNTSNTLTVTVDKGTGVPASSVPDPTDPSSAWYHENDHYFFERWSADFSNVQEDLTVNAIYEFRQDGYFTVTFRDWNGAILQVNENNTQSVKEGANAIAPPIPTRAGFVFKSWDKDIRDVHQNMTVYATYASIVSKTYTVNLNAVYGPLVPLEETHVTWYANNDTGWSMNSEETVINDNIDIETPEHYEYDQDEDDVRGDLVRPGYTFLGWARLPEYMEQKTGEYADYTVLSDYQVVDANTHNWHKILQYENLTSEDLWLKYNPADKDHPDGPYFTVREKVDGEYQLLNGGAAFEYIAANENDPYHGLYAVWERDVFYVMHSSDGTIEAIGMPVDSEHGATVDGLSYKVGTFDLTTLVSANHLYGGYYVDYGGANNEAVTKAAHSFTFEGLDGWTTSAFDSAEASHPYTVNEQNAWDEANFFEFNSYNGDYIYGDNSNTPTFVRDGSGNIVFENGKPKLQYEKFWQTDNFGEHYELSGELMVGTALQPTEGKVYYLKEVPDAYLHSRIFFVNNNSASGNNADNPGPITKLYLLSYVDDNLYDRVGFKYVNYVNSGSVAVAQNTDMVDADFLSNTFTLTTHVNGNPTAVTIDNTVFGGGLQRGLVAVSNLNALIVTNTDVLMIPTWITYDGIEVTQDPMLLTMNSVAGSVTKIECSRRFPDYFYVDFSESAVKDTYGNSFNWLKDGAIPQVRFFNDSENLVVWVNLQQVGTSSIYRCLIPEGNIAKIIIGRENWDKPDGSDEEDTWTWAQWTYESDPEDEWNSDRLWAKSGDITFSWTTTDNCLTHFRQDYGDGQDTVWGSYAP